MMSASRKANKGSDDVEFLLKTVDEQNGQISRLQSKFRDVTHAYRSLLEEKKALEITIKALKTTRTGSYLNPKSADPTNNKTHGSRNDLNALQAPANTSRTPSVSDLSEIETHSNADSVDLDSSNPKSLQQNLNDLNQEEKINALTSNIQLLIDSKSKLERGFQAERKKLKVENDEIKAKLDTAKAESESRIKELRVSLKQVQQEREKMAADLNVMSKSKSAEQENKILSMQEENQSILINFRNENNSLKQKLKQIMKQFDNKCEELAQLERESKHSKESHAELVREKEDMLSDMRERLQHTQNSSELRIGNLESKINELCTIISKKENGSLEDTLAVFAKCAPKINEDVNSLKSKPVQFEHPSDLDTAIEQLQDLKTYIETTSKELNIKFDFNEIFCANQFNSDLEQVKAVNKKLSDQIDSLKEENRHLKEEYEKYKIRTNYLIKSAKYQTSKESAPAPRASQESEHQLKQTLKKCKDEVDILNKRIHLASKDHLEEIRKLNEQFEQQEILLRNDFKVQLDKVKHERLESIQDLERELVKQRERTVKLLNEREEELGALKGNYTVKNISPIGKNGVTRSSSENNNLRDLQSSMTSIDLNKSLNNEQPVANDLELSTALKHSAEFINADGNNRIIHYSQEAAYQDMELKKLRILKAELEYKLKQVNDEHSVDIERFQSQIGVLKQEIERINLNQNRAELNSANLEYIKNVVFNFMTTKDANVKVSMQTALTHILKFTKLERQKIQASSTQVY